MNTDKARKLRKLIYGDMSQRIPRSYVTEHGSIVNAPDSPRGKYRKAKKEAR